MEQKIMVVLGGFLVMASVWLQFLYFQPNIANRGLLMPAWLVIALAGLATIAYSQK